MSSGIIARIVYWFFSVIVQVLYLGTGKYATGPGKKVKVDSVVIVHHAALVIDPSRDATQFTQKKILEPDHVLECIGIKGVYPAMC